ncbi:hypothetical protein K7432_016340 [Basidiobolus ranarum]|uniref:Uncharacterized protein n=1 Tax=Basidiobolus ranarum TaxID=34480 RepID=A0ABR2WEW4_9FUNG
MKVIATNIVVVKAVTIVMISVSANGVQVVIDLVEIVLTAIVIEVLGGVMIVI